MPTTRQYVVFPKQARSTAEGNILISSGRLRAINCQGFRIDFDVEAIAGGSLNFRVYEWDDAKKAYVVGSSPGSLSSPGHQTYNVDPRNGAAGSQQRQPPAQFQLRIEGSATSATYSLALTLGD